MSAPLTLRLRSDAGALPVDAAALSPDRIAGLPRGEIERLPLFAGSRRVALGDLFEVADKDGGEATDEIAIEGDLRSFARIGAWMTRGRLTVLGPVGARAGTGMSGGTLVIDGSVGPYAGEGMTGGLLRIHGGAGDHLAAPLPGARRGMNRGSILVEGSAGEMAAFRMRRGTIVIAGEAGPGAACSMLAGTLVVLGRLGAGAGALMRRGTIVALGPADPLPVFLDAGRRAYPFLNIFYDAIETAGIRLPAAARRGLYRRRVGDISDLGKGEILTLEGTA
jgi:formylmethanofuran dehydrogenase subunit C